MKELRNVDEARVARFKVSKGNTYLVGLGTKLRRNERGTIIIVGVGGDENDNLGIVTASSCL